MRWIIADFYVVGIPMKVSSGKSLLQCLCLGIVSTFQQPLSYKLLLFRFPNFHKHFYTLQEGAGVLLLYLCKKYWFFAT